MSEVGLREMRQNANELVRRAQSGELVTITVAGRPAAVLGPVRPCIWRRWDDLAAIFTAPAEDDWAYERNLLGGSPADPWPQQ